MAKKMKVDSLVHALIASVGAVWETLDVEDQRDAAAIAREHLIRNAADEKAKKLVRAIFIGDSE